MLLSSISSSIISSSASSTAVSMITTPGLPHYGALIVAGLIALLSLKEVLSGSERWTKLLTILLMWQSYLCFSVLRELLLFKVAAII